jgi:transcription elongation factor GreA
LLKTMTISKLTKIGKENLQKELDELVNNKRPKLVERLSYARSQGDLSENSDYQSAKEELDFLDGRIDELQEVLQNASVVSVSKNGKTGVDVGTKVTVKVNGNKTVFNIVGEWEADPVNKKISESSPLGLALAGKKVGDKAEVEAPAGRVLYEIVAID